MYMYTYTDHGSCFVVYKCFSTGVRTVVSQEEDSDKKCVMFEAMVIITIIIVYQWSNCYFFRSLNVHCLLCIEWNLDHY